VTVVALAASAGLALGTVARAEGSDVSGSAAGGAWSATTHMGFAVVDRSTTGMEKVTGSLVLLDVGRRVTSTVDLGFRSAAQGGKRPGKEYYRLAAGPVVSWRFADRWLAQVALGLFEESGLDGSGDPSYESRGHTVTFNWQRTFPLGKRAELAWGGFMMRHQGDVALPEATEDGDRAPGEATASAQLGAATNVGLSHGALAAFRVRL
jgi:hypothetical protein